MFEYREVIFVTMFRHLWDYLFQTLLSQIIPKMALKSKRDYFCQSLSAREIFPDAAFPLLDAYCFAICIRRGENVLFDRKSLIAGVCEAHFCSTYN